MEINNTVKQYLALKQEMKFLSERKGHTILEVDGVTLTNQRKVSNPIDVEVAEKIIKEKGLEDTCMPKKPTLDSQAIMAALYKKELTEEEIAIMFPDKVSYAFIVK